MDGVCRYGNGWSSVDGEISCGCPSACPCQGVVHETFAGDRAKDPQSRRVRGNVPRARNGEQHVGGDSRGDDQQEDGGVTIDPIEAAAPRCKEPSDDRDLEYHDLLDGVRPEDAQVEELAEERHLDARRAQLERVVPSNATVFGERTGKGQEQRDRGCGKRQCKLPASREQTGGADCGEGSRHDQPRIVRVLQCDAR